MYFRDALNAKLCEVIVKSPYLDPSKITPTDFMITRQETEVKAEIIDQKLKAWAAMSGTRK